MTKTSEFCLFPLRLFRPAILLLLTIRSFWSQDDALILLALDDLKRVKEMLLAVLDRRRILLVAGEVRMDELDQPVQIFRGDLVGKSANTIAWNDPGTDEVGDAP